MLALDPLGLSLTMGGLALIFGGRRPLLRAALSVFLGDVGRLLLAAVLGGHLLGVTFGGAFTRLGLSGGSPGLVQWGGLLVGALLGLPLGRRTARDGLIYAALAGAAVLWLFK